MAITGSSGTGGHNPWRRSPNEGPPDLFHLLKKFLHNLSLPTGKFNGGLDSMAGIVAGVIIGIIILLWLLSGIFVVAPAEQAVVLRFGKYIGTLNAGPHWLPRFIESEYKVNVQRVDSFPYQSEMLSKDENIVTVKLQVQYRIDNPRNYLFNIVDPVKTVQQAVSSALRQMVGHMDLDPLITTGRELLTQQVTTKVKQILNEYDSGIEIVEIALQEVKPPIEVTSAFDDVVKAREDKQSYINKAQAYAKKRVLMASGIASRLQQDADAYSYTVVAKSQGETARYLALLKPYQKAPEVTRERLYFDTLANVLSKTSNIIVSNGLNNNVLYLPLEQLLRQHNGTISPTTQQNNNDDGIGLNDTIRQPTLLEEQPSTKIVYPERPSYSNEGGHQ